MSQTFKRGDVEVTRYWRGENRYAVHNTELTYAQLKELGHIIRYLVRTHEQAMRNKKRGPR